MMSRHDSTTRTSLRTCYITSAGASDLAPLLSYLRSRGITPLSPNVMAAPGERVVDAVGAAIRKADVVVAVVSGDELDPNVIFEVGYAHGRGKPVVVIGPEGLRVPPHMSGFMLIPDGLANPPGLAFNLDILLKAPSSPGRTYRGSGSAKETGRSSNVRQLIARWHSTSEYIVASQLEEYVSELLKASGASFVAHSPAPERGADFAVWFDKLYPYIGGPLLVEVKSALDSFSAAANARDQGERYLEQAHANCLLVLYNRGISDEELNARFGTPSLFFCTIKGFEDNVKDRDAAEVIGALRNRLAHGAPA